MRDAPVQVLYEQMRRARRVEEALEGLWNDGHVSGEMHSGRGEEGAVIGVLHHLRDGDAVATDHRSTLPFVTRGADVTALTLEMLGHADGLCAGQGGHMHLFDPERLLASSGIVGASGPTACGFALAAQQTGDGGVAVAFFGEGATNQGMLLEAYNLAAAWRLPVVFVCKDDGWSITTRSKQVSGGNPARRARGFGLRAVSVDGRRVDQVWAAAGYAVRRARDGRGPTFLHVKVRHDAAHFLGFQLKALVQDPVNEAPQIVGPLVRSVLRRGGRLGPRASALTRMTRTMGAAGASWSLPHRDPLDYARSLLPEDVADAIDAAVEEEIGEAVRVAVDKALGKEPA